VRGRIRRTGEIPRRPYMNRQILIFLLLALLVPISFQAQESQVKQLLIRDVTIIDCAGHSPMPDMSVLVSNGRITAIGPAAKLKPSTNAEILDARWC
jgi:hypothetical protein